MWRAVSRPAQPLSEAPVASGVTDTPTGDLPVCCDSETRRRGDYSFPVGSQRSRRGSESLNLSLPVDFGRDPVVAKQPVRRKLFLESLTSGPKPVPPDWKQRLEMILASVPPEATLDQLIASVADVTPDRCRTLIQAVENEVDVMEDAMNDVVAEQVRQFKAQQKVQLQSLQEESKASQDAAFAAQERLYRLVPDFDWDRYSSDPDYLRKIIIRQEAENPQAFSDAIAHYKAMKRLLQRFIDQVNERQSKMEADLKKGVLMSVPEEIKRVQKENTACRSLYKYLASVSNQMH